MGSIDAKNVAKEVLENLGKDKKVNLGKIARKHGYAKNTADNPKNITETKSFKAIIDPVIASMIKERSRLIKAISGKNLDEVKYKDAVEAVDKLTKNIQLLNGGKTANEAIQISWET